jgi:hypothetical protein
MGYRYVGRGHQPHRLHLQLADEPVVSYPHRYTAATTVPTCRFNWLSLKVGLGSSTRCCAPNTLLGQNRMPASDEYERVLLENSLLLWDLERQINCLSVHNNDRRYHMNLGFLRLGCVLHGRRVKGLKAREQIKNHTIQGCHLHHQVDAA